MHKDRVTTVLQFIYDRLVHVYKENPQHDYMIFFNGIIEQFAKENK